MADVQMGDAETFYSNKEIFLRELISNSSDQEDKEMLVPHPDVTVDGVQSMEVVRAELAVAAATVEGEQQAAAEDAPTTSRHTWKIEKFSRLHPRKHYSEVLVVGGFKWRVLIFPKGNNVDHLSMYLDVANLSTLQYGWSRYAQFNLSVVNQLNSKYTIRKGL